jgi:putative hydrolase of the HAD superfamily
MTGEAAMQEPRAIFFDLDGTILDWQTGMEVRWREACERGCAQVDGLAPGALFDAIIVKRDEFWADTARANAGRMDLHAASRSIVTEALLSLGIDRPDLATEIAGTYRTQRDAALGLYAGALETLRSVRARGIATALITNGSATGQRQSIERFGLAQYFDCIVIEGEFGCGKPDERVFRHALSACGVAPQDTWMIGDSLEMDIATPLRLGMRTVWVDALGAGLPDGEVRPHRVVRSLAEVMGPKRRSVM